MTNSSAQAIQMSGTYRQVIFPMEVKIGAKGHAKMQVVNPDASIALEIDQDNLILNQGLDGIATQLWCDSFLYCAAGSGSTPTSDSSGATTGTQAGTTVTLTGGSFTFTSTLVDAGKIIRWTGGQQATIVTVTSGTQATVNVSQSVSANTFTVYRTNQVGLGTEVVRTNTYVTGAGNCGSSLAGNILSHQRTFSFPVEVGSVTYREVGFSALGVAGNNLFSRIKLNSDLPLVAGQSLRVVYTLQLTLSPNTPNAKAASVVGWPVSPAVNTNGAEQIQYIGMSAVDVGTAATTNFDAGKYVNEPSYVTAVDIFLSDSPTALAVFGNSADRTGTFHQEDAAVLTSYATGSYALDKFCVFSTTEGNSASILSCGVGRVDSGLHSYINSGFVFLFSQDQTKDFLHTLELHFTYSWSVDLS